MEGLGISVGETGIVVSAEAAGKKPGRKGKVLHPSVEQNVLDSLVYR
jgi:hypothetical protein